MKDLKHVHGAASEEAAGTELLNPDEKMGSEKYPVVVKPWQDKRERLAGYFQFTTDIRRMAYTANAVGGFPDFVTQSSVNL